MSYKITRTKISRKIWTHFKKENACYWAYRPISDQQSEHGPTTTINTSTSPFLHFCKNLSLLVPWNSCWLPFDYCHLWIKKYTVCCIVNLRNIHTRPRFFPRWNSQNRTFWYDGYFLEIFYISPPPTLRGVSNIILFLKNRLIYDISGKCSMHHQLTNHPLVKTEVCLFTIGLFTNYA